MSDEFITLLCVNRQTDNIFYALVSKVIAYTHFGASYKAYNGHMYVYTSICMYQEIETMQKFVQKKNDNEK